MTLSCGCTMVEVNGTYFVEDYCDEHEPEYEEEIKIPIRKFKTLKIY